MAAYDAFADAAGSGAFKIVLEGAKHQQLQPIDEVVATNADRENVLR
jgi:hypothetical protein